jgi:hypothetical protein
MYKIAELVQQLPKIFEEPSHLAGNPIFDKHLSV